MALRLTKLNRDKHGNIVLAAGETPPASGQKGFATGCIFIDTNAATFGAVRYVNTGTALSCTFVAETALQNSGTISTYFNATLFETRWIWTNPINQSILVTFIGEVHTVAGTDAGAVTADVRKGTVGSGLAPSGGVSLLNAAMSLKTTANTSQGPTLAAAANRTLAAFDRIGVVFAGTPTALAGGIITLGYQIV